MCAVAISSVAALTLSGLPQSAASEPSGKRPASPAAATADERMGNYDSRVGTVKQQMRQARATTARGKVTSARGTLTGSLGSEGVADFDTLTGTPRNLGKLDGYLTGASSAAARDVALTYVRANAAALGLRKADLTTFKLSRDYVDVDGTHHLSWTQTARGVTLFGNGLKANVTKNGRLISLQGAPVSGLAAKAARADATASLSATRARTTAAADVGGATAAAARTTVGKSGATRWANHDYAKPVWFYGSKGLRLGWSTYVQAGDDLNYQHVVDASTGDVLFRRDTTNFDRGDALVYENYPGADEGGEQRVVNLYDEGFLFKNSRVLTGNAVVAWADVDDDNARGGNEKVKVPGKKNGPAQYELAPFGAEASGLCSPSFLCTWNPNEADSWRTNLEADVTQGFYFNNVFYEWLKAGPIGFRKSAGNFGGNDPVLLHSLDGADTADGLPDLNHVDNANMSTPPDGTPPTMQMYLFHAPGFTDEEEPLLPASSSYDPSVIFHEYTHGLSNRLVVDAVGNSTLSSLQAGSMGEAWGDWYALDYLVHKGYQADTADEGEVLLAKYLNAGVDTKILRTMPMDCSVGSTDPDCTDAFGEVHGGYTYGEMSSIIGVAEVHASGEIWAQTLWDLRDEIGHWRAARLVTRAMELSPNDPSFLDMRNALVQADTVAYNGRNHDAIWSVFANRGMGYFAGSLGSADAFPVENFDLPPADDAPTSSVQGQITDWETGEPIAGALVSISGHNSGFGGDYSAITDASGRYSIDGVFVGPYPYVTVFAPGYEVLNNALAVTEGGTTADFAPRRDWVATSGGAEIVDFNGPDYTDFGCGPGNALDLSQGAGWGSTTGDDAGTPTNVMIPKYIVVELPQAIDLTDLAINPSNTCGDPGSSSTGDYSVEASADGTAWTTVDEGTFTAADRNQLVQISVDTTEDVKFVRYTILSPQVPDFATNCPLGAFGGCTYTDTTEVEVFGPMAQ